ncbi:voltage-gated chloride channel family protein [Dyadobacter sp. CY327]|uniref:voltage-gated chloride channel family protein n=1 Tax=Dyadobacter sp. CY327 TaxID=2907301 RepID=UPI001F3F52EE|nr:voltage-gated chloride channel family protein [Dyadobacter sp. CY327]MCE7072277.1 voltage-gated chloride channel family protein [Dyadobacter sp. CY327]
MSGNAKLFKNFPTLFISIKWVLLACLIGVFAGSASALFLVSLDWATQFRESHHWIIALLPVAGFVIGCMYHYLGKDVEAGNNLLLENIHQPATIIPLKMAPFVLIGTVATHLFGGSAGREGTALQMGGSIADQFTRIFKLNSSDRKLVIIAGIAAGFGSVFGTPLAGAIFGIEVLVIGRLRYDALVPALIASVVADMTTRAWQVGHTHYEIPFVPEISLVHILYAVLAGCIFGICSVAFSSLTHYIGSIFKSKVRFAPLRPLIGGSLVALAVFGMDTTRYIGLGIPVILQSFSEQLPAYDFVLKILFTAVTLGAAFKGGEVTPLFFIGATLGSFLSTFIPLPTALLAGMGFVAVFAGAANTPLACTIMAIELFGSSCGIFVALACTTAYFFSGHRGIYTAQRIGRRKPLSYDWRAGKSF